MGRRRATALFVLLVSIAGTPGTPALAAPPTSTPDAVEQRRSATYRAGVTAATAGQWTEAKRLFLQTIALRSSPKALFSLAQSEEQLGETASAQASYEEARAAAVTAREAEVVRAVDQAQAALEPRVPHVHLVIRGATGATARLDGRPLASSLVVAADPGRHRLVVEAQDCEPFATTIDLRERQQFELVVDLHPLRRPSPLGGARPATATLAVSPPSPSTAKARDSVAATLGLVTAGVGIVGLGLGTYFGVEARTKNDESYGDGCRGNVCPSSAAATRNSALSWAGASTAAFIAGGVLAAGGIVVWLAAPSGTTDAAPGGARSAGIVAVPLPGGGGALLSGRF